MKREQRIGKHGQSTAAAVLSGRCGINMVEQIGTPVLLIPVQAQRRNTYQVIFGEKVSGDHRGVIGRRRTQGTRARRRDSQLIVRRLRKELICPISLMVRLGNGVSFIHVL
jgi:hypothetical protein